jgi:beta-phosphoglucomutase family hydrolase
MTEPELTAAIFDLDGVLTQTATLHGQAWKRLFDSFLAERSRADGRTRAPFELESDYRLYVDGKPREDGIRSFLHSRGIQLPEDQIRDLGDRKNEIFLDLLEREGVRTFADAVAQVDRWRRQGLRMGLITSSRNGRRILEAAGLLSHFEVIVDGLDAARLGITGKPAPDIFLHAARELGVMPSRAIVVEDAISGVEAGVAGGFGLVIGVARNGGDELSNAGAHLVVSDLSALRELPLKSVGKGGRR